MPSRHAAASLGGIDAVHLVLVGGAAQESHDEAAVGEVVQQGEFLGGSDGVVQRHQGAEHGDFDRLAAFGDGGGHHRRRAGDDSPRVMVLGEADPLEPHLLGELAFLHAVLVALHGGFGIAVAGRSGPGGREVAAVSVAHRAQVRCFHVRQLLSRMSSEQLFQLVQQTLHISQSGGHVVGIVPILVGINAGLLQRQTTVGFDRRRSRPPTAR